MCIYVYIYVYMYINDRFYVFIYVYIFHRFTDSNYGARCVKNIEDNVICLNKQQIKHAVAYLLFDYYFTVNPKIFCQITDIPMGSDPAPFFFEINIKRIA